MKEPKPDISLKYEEPGARQSAFREETRIETVWGKVRVVSAVPSWTPKGTQEDSMALYVSGTTQRLYFYDFTNNVWRYFTRTTVASDGGAALEGDIEIAGNGIEVTQDGQTITIGNGTPFIYKTSGSFTSTDLDPNLDFTMSVGFDPRMIHLYGRLDPSALSGAYYTSIIQASSPTISSTPHIWLNDGTYPVGRQEQSVNPVVFSDHTSAFIKSDLAGSSHTFSVIINSHNSTSTVLRIRRDVGSGSRTVGYKFVIIAFP